MIRPRKGKPANVGFRMMKPGAFHHARFMAKSQYMLKSFMLREAIPEIVTPDIQDDIRRMVDYIVYFHGPYFLKARLATATPRLDLNRWRDMCQCEVG